MTLSSQKLYNRIPDVKYVDKSNDSVNDFLRSLNFSIQRTLAITNSPKDIDYPRARVTLDAVVLSHIGLVLQS